MRHAQRQATSSTGSAIRVITLAESISLMRTAPLSSAHYATPKLGHTPGKVEIEDSVPAACEKDGGCTEIFKCTVCGKIAEQQTL